MKRIVFYIIFIVFFLIFLILLIIQTTSLQTPQIEYAFLFLKNPYFIDFNSINLPPSTDYWFGTDALGRDLFALVIFALSSFLLFLYLFSAGMFRISMDFMSMTTDQISSSSKMYFFQIIGNFPNLPVLVLIAINLKFIETTLLFNFLIFLFISLLSWIKVADLVERNNIDHNQEGLSYLTHPIILHTMGSLMIDLTILSFFGHISDKNITFGNILVDIIENQPLVYWWGWVFPLVFLVLFVSFLRSSVLRT